MKHQKGIKGTMGKHLSSSLGGAASALLLLGTSHSWACGQGGGAISIFGLPTLGGSLFQATALNAAGQVAGYSTIVDDAEQHAFLYSGGLITDLGTLGGNFSQGLALNASGQVVGRAKTASGATHAALFGSGPATDLGTLSGVTSFASAINDAGLVGGESDAPNGETHAFTFAGGSLSDLGTLGLFFSSVAGLNNAGVVVGDSSTLDFVNHAYLSTNGTLLDLGDLGGGDYSSARAINDAGVVVGEADTASFDTHAFAYANGVMSDLGTLGGSFSSASAVNQAGQVIGQSTTAPGSALHGFFYSNGTLSDLGTLGGDSATPRALNNLGQVVGESRTADFAQHPFLWQNGAMVDLNTLLPAGSGWELISARLINDAGRIVGQGFYNGVDQWYALDLASGANHAPVAVAGPDQSGSCQAPLTLDGSASSDPDGDALSFQWSEGTVVLGTNAVLTAAFDPGTHTLTLTVSDPCGDSAQTNVTVTVTDTTAPVIVGGPAAAIVSANANGQGATPDVAAQIIASDSCSPANQLVITQNPVAGTFLGLGLHPIIVTVKDAAGNSVAGSTSFTVVDTTAPAILGTPAPISIPVGEHCLGTVPNVVSQIVPADNCTPANLLVVTQSPAAGTSVAAGQYVIVVTVKDAAGNSANAGVSFAVVDSKAPVILSAPTCLTAAANSNCQAAVPNVLTNIVATDNCTPANLLVMTQSPAAGTLLGRGEYVVTVNVKDASGNSVTRNIAFNVKDTTAPVIYSVNASPNVLTPVSNQLVPITVSVVAADNCDGAPSSKIVCIKSTGGDSDGDVQITGKLTAKLAAKRNSGGNARIYTITVQCTDASGNSSTGTTTVTVPRK